MEQKIDRSVFRDLSYGLYLVTSADEGRLNGQVINTLIQVTSDPPRVAVIIDKNNFTHELIHTWLCLFIQVFGNVQNKPVV
jgi:flavin reductase (DIM6/NTAB) family NADH-FMN oxidoreductase RutF